MARVEISASSTTQGEGKMVLRGRRCQCVECGKYFNSDFAFGKHRTGKYEPLQRRCRTEQEMIDRGMVVTESGFWASELRVVK